MTASDIAELETQVSGLEDIIWGKNDEIVALHKRLEEQTDEIYTLSEAVRRLSLELAGYRHSGSASRLPLPKAEGISEGVSKLNMHTGSMK